MIVAMRLCIFEPRRGEIIINILKPHKKRGLHSRKPLFYNIQNRLVSVDAIQVFESNL